MFKCLVLVIFISWLGECHYGFSKDFGDKRFIVTTNNFLFHFSEEFEQSVTLDSR